MKHVFRVFSMIAILFIAMSFTSLEPPVKKIMVKPSSINTPELAEAKIKLEALAAKVTTKLEQSLIDKGERVEISFDRFTAIEKAEFRKYAELLSNTGAIVNQRCCTACTPIPGGPAIRTCCVYYYINGVFADCQQEICDLWAPDLEQPCGG